MKCVTFKMNNVEIKKTDGKTVLPSMGDTLQAVPVTYTFTAYTPTNGDTFVAKGSITANK